MVDLMELTKKFETINFMETVSCIRGKKKGIYIDKGYQPVVLSISNQASDRLHIVTSLLQAITGCFVLYNNEMEELLYEEALGMLMKEKDIHTVIELDSRLFHNQGQIEAKSTESHQQEIKKIIDMHRLPASMDVLTEEMQYIREVVHKGTLKVTVDEYSLYPTQNTYPNLIFSLVQIVQYMQMDKK